MSSVPNNILDPVGTQPQANTELPSMPKPAITNGSGSVKGDKTPMYVGLALIVVVMVLALIGGAYLFLTKGGIFSSSGPVNSINSTLGNSIAGIVESIDFEKIDDPSNFVSFESLNSLLDESFVLGLDYGSLKGKTFHTAFDMSIKGPKSADTEVDLKLDLYTKYPESFNSDKYEKAKTYSETLALLQSMTAEEFKADIGTFVIKLDMGGNSMGEPLNLKAELTYINEKLFLNIKETNIPGFTEITGKTILIDTKEFSDEIIESFLEVYDSYPADFEAISQFSNEDLVEEFFESIDLDETQLDLIKRVGNPTRDVLAKNLKEFNLFTNVSTVDPIRVTSSKCEQGLFNTDGLVKFIDSSALQIAEIITADKDYEGPSLKEIQSILPMLTAEIPNSIQDAKFSLKMRACGNSDELNGLGFSVAFSPDGSETFEVSIDYLLANQNSDFVIAEPSTFDIDLTKEVNETVKQIDFKELLSPDELNSTFMNGSESSFENFGEDQPYNFSTEDDTDYDAYFDELNAILDEYVDGNLTDAEYEMKLKELETKYM